VVNSLQSQDRLDKKDPTGSLTILTLITPYNNFSSVLPHFAKKLPGLTHLKKLGVIC
jgi:hypothetical protein